jgi:hypothetical protein
LGIGFKQQLPPGVLGIVKITFGKNSSLCFDLITIHPCFFFNYFEYELLGGCNWKGQWI